MSERNTLTVIRDLFDGSLNKALLTTFAFIFGGMLITFYWFGVDATRTGLLVNSVIGFGLLFFSMFLKVKYPKKRYPKRG